MRFKFVPNGLSTARKRVLRPGEHPSPGVLIPDHEVQEPPQGVIPADGWMLTLIKAVLPPPQEKVS